MNRAWNPKRKPGKSFALVTPWKLFDQRELVVAQPSCREHGGAASAFSSLISLTNVLPSFCSVP